MIAILVLGQNGIKVAREEFKLRLKDAQPKCTSGKITKQIAKSS